MGGVRVCQALTGEDSGAWVPGGMTLPLHCCVCQTSAGLHWLLKLHHAPFQGVFVDLAIHLLVKGSLLGY